MAEAPLAFSRAARLGRGAMTLGAMPCPASERKKRKKGEEKKKTDKRKRKREDVLEKRGKKKQERKQKKVHRLENIVLTASKHPCL